jgi:hypothetical protein
MRRALVPAPRHAQADRENATHGGWQEHAGAWRANRTARMAGEALPALQTQKSQSGGAFPRRDRLSRLVEEARFVFQNEERRPGASAHAAASRGRAHA